MAAGVSLPTYGVASDFLGRVKFGALRSDLSHAVSIECEAASVVDEPVEDGVGATSPLFRILMLWIVDFVSKIFGAC
jgi:hypothetical protein